MWAGNGETREKSGEQSGDNRHFEEENEFPGKEPDKITQGMRKQEKNQASSPGTIGILKRKTSFRGMNRANAGREWAQAEVGRGVRHRRREQKLQEGNPGFHRYFEGNNKFPRHQRSLLGNETDKVLISVSSPAG